MELSSLQASTNILREQAFASNVFSQSKPSNSNSFSDFDSIKHKLHQLFLFYASFGDRSNYNLLKSNKFHKLMSDSRILNNSDLTKKRLDLLFVSGNHHRSYVDFNEFLDLLVKIANYKYQEIEDNSALFKLLEENLLPLYENIREETDFGETEKKGEESFPVEIIEKISKIFNIFEKIYIAFFPWEPKCFQNYKIITERSLKALCEFLKEFDICPNIITKSMVYTLFYQALEENDEILYKLQKNDIGTVFKLSNFLAFIVKIAIVSKSNEENPVLIEKFELMLERMELSEGFQALNKRLNLPNTSKFTLISTKSRISSIMNESNTIENSYISQKIEVNKEISVKIKPFFLHYCSLGEPLNSTRLKTIKFMRFLKDYHFLPSFKLSQIDVDLLVAKLTKKTPGKLDFFAFYLALQGIYQKIVGNNEENHNFSDFLDSYLSISEKKIKEKTSKYMEKLMEILQDEAIIDLLGEVQKGLKCFFDNYSIKNRMSLEKWLIFCKDFEIFPQMLSKSKLNQIFESLVSLLGEKENTIDHHLFIEGLALCGLEVGDDCKDIGNIEKVILFLERINQSEGMENSQKDRGLIKKKWDLLAGIRNKFQVENNEERKNVKFEDVLRESTNFH